MDTYLQYFKSLHSLAASLFVIFLFALTQVFGICKLHITSLHCTKDLFIPFFKECQVIES